MKPVWKEHPLTFAGAVEEVPLEWLWQYWASDVTDAILTKYGLREGYDDFWERLCEEGLRDPLILRVGLENHKVRLEAGNHRIQVMRAHDIEYIPLTVQVRHLCGPNAPGPMTDATKVFDFPKEGIKISEITTEYMKPSDVFWNFAV